MLLVIPQGKQKFYGIVLFIPKEKVDLNVPLISDNLEKYLVRKSAIKTPTVFPVEISEELNLKRSL